MAVVLEEVSWWRGLIPYALAIGCEIPFIAQPFYPGPLVKPLGGADVSWLGGWIVAAGVYLFLVPRTRQASRRGG